MRKLMSVAAVSFFLLACAQAQEPKQDPADLLKSTDIALQKAVADGDLDKIMTFYADDAVLMPTAEPIVVGKAAIREEWHHILSIPDFQNKSALTKIDVSQSGDLAYSMGTYLSTMQGENGQPVTEPGKWLSVWRRQADGSWLIVADTYNTDIPPPDHK